VAYMSLMPTARDQQANLLARLYPATSGARPAGSFGLAGALPGLNPPAPVLPPTNTGRLGSGYAPTSSGPLAPAAAPSQVQGFGGVLSNPPRDPYGTANWTPEERKMFDQMNASWYAGPDFKGRHEAGQLLRGAAANLFNQWAAQPSPDVSGQADIGDRFAQQRDQLLSALAARGISGGDVEAGVRSNLAGSEARALSDYVSQILQKQQDERQAQLNQLNQFYQQLGMMGLQQNIQQQNSPGFWGDVGSFLGAVAPTVIGAVTGVPKLP
jgi:hypothetical protein